MFLFDINIFIIVINKCADKKSTTFHDISSHFQTYETWKRWRIQSIDYILNDLSVRDLRRNGSYSWWPQLWFFGRLEPILETIIPQNDCRRYGHFSINISVLKTISKIFTSHLMAIWISSQSDIAFDDRTRLQIITDKEVHNFDAFLNESTPKRQLSRLSLRPTQTSINWSLTCRQSLPTKRYKTIQKRLKQNNYLLILTFVLKFE